MRQDCTALQQVFYTPLTHTLLSYTHTDLSYTNHNSHTHTHAHTCHTHTHTHTHTSHTHTTTLIHTYTHTHTHTHTHSHTPLSLVCPVFSVSCVFPLMAEQRDIWSLSPDRSSNAVSRLQLSGRQRSGRGRERERKRERGREREREKERRHFPTLATNITVSPQSRRTITAQPEERLKNFCKENKKHSDLLKRRRSPSQLRGGDP